MIAHRSLLAVAAFLVLSGSAVRANTISPGQSGITPDLFSTSDFSLVWISASGLEFNFDGGLTTGTFQEAVLNDTSNPYCSSCLDFAFVFNVTDPNNFITSLDLSSFAGFETDGGYATMGGSPITPNSMSRDSAGDTVGFTYSVGVLPGDESAILVVQTNATNYDYNGVVTYVDDNGVSFMQGGFVEPVATPEPSSAALLGVGILALASFRKKLLRFTAVR